MTSNAILFAILLVILAAATMYFCKHFKIGQRDKEDNSRMSSALPDDGVVTDGEVRHSAPEVHMSPECRMFSKTKTHKQEMKEALEMDKFIDSGASSSVMPEDANNNLDLKCRSCKAFSDPREEMDNDPNPRCRIVFRGTPKEGSNQDKAIEYEMTVKKEFEQLKR